MVSGATAEARDSAWHQFNFYPDHYHHHHHDTVWNPNLEINYSLGKPGSYFHVTGEDYPPFDQAEVWMNGYKRGELNVDQYGEVSFDLRTDDADEGVYYVTVKVSSNSDIQEASVTVDAWSDTDRFEIDRDSPLRQRVGSGKVFDVPAGIAFTEFVYLPLVSRDG